MHSKNEKDPFVSKDLSILKYSVPEFIEGNKDLMSKINEIKDADIKDFDSWMSYMVNFHLVWMHFYLGSFSLLGRI